MIEDHILFSRPGDGSVVLGVWVQPTSPFLKGNLLRHAETIVSQMCLVLDCSQLDAVCRISRIYGFFWQ